MNVLLNSITLRRRNVPRFVRTMAQRHPELRGIVAHEDFLRMAARDHVHVRLANLPACQRARTFAVGGEQFIRLNRTMAIGEQALQGMHELCHIWRDKPISGAYYSDELTGGESCEFADLFAWYVTSTARFAYDPDFSQIDLPL